MENTKNDSTESKEFKISGGDIRDYINKIFRAGNSRKAIFKHEDGKHIFSINFVLLVLIFVIIPLIALITFILLILTGSSLSIAKK